MTNSEYYQCSICNTLYKTEGEMNVCMASHERADEITKMEYHSYKLDDSKYPDSIIIRFTDGHLRRYHIV